MAAQTYLWNKAPALRLLLPFAAGIAAQWYMQFTASVLWVMALLTALLLLFFFIFPLSKRFRLQAAAGILLNFLMAIAGAALVWVNDVRNNENWIGNQYREGDKILATLQEPLVEKTSSYKALATVKGILKSNSNVTATGNIIIYFKKDAAANLGYGSQIILQKSLQPIKNSGNPGGFNYQRYSLFHRTTHQAYVTANDFVLLPQKDERVLKKFLYRIQSSVINILQRYIKGSKEQGLAEALLIGYKDDLDKNLVQSYSNTGVVHIIAISGLHLGLIYWLLMLVTKPLKRKHLNGLRVVIIICALWIFSLLAGAQPSVLRSAIMFTAIAIAGLLDRRTSIYNTMALSAFILLVIDPYWLWDVGFQLSYAAVLSIIIFFRPVYNLIYLPNKALDYLWQLMAVSIAAQILTTPISLFHFHQFPLLFLFTNFVAVPLSSIILFGEIALCAFAFLPLLAQVIGVALHHTIRFMNNYIERLDAVSFAVWDGIYINILQTLLLLALITAAAYFLLEKNRTAFKLSLLFLLLFIAIRSASFIETGHQKKMIVYNIPKVAAIDVMDGRQLSFIGDAALLQNDFLQNFHLKPSRILHRAQSIINNKSNAFLFYGKRILIIDASLINTQKGFQNVDVAVLSKNPKLNMAQLLTYCNIKQMVIDASVPAWKAKQWKQDCNAQNIPCHDVNEKGAFVMNLH